MQVSILSVGKPLRNLERYVERKDSSDRKAQMSLKIYETHEMDKIARILEDQKEGNNLEQKFYLVWYVFNASDNTFPVDDGLLDLVTSAKYGVPVLLVMTHNDCRGNFLPLEHLQHLLDSSIEDPSRRGKLMADMISLGNSPSFRKGDRRGMKRLLNKTRDMVTELKWQCWKPSQDYINEKLRMSVRKIIHGKLLEAIWTWIGGGLPFVQELHLGAMFLQVTNSLGEIWEVPKPLLQALIAEFFENEGLNLLEGHFAKHIWKDLGIALGVSGICSSNLILGIGFVPLFMATLACRKFKEASLLFMVYSLQVLGAILYSKFTCPTDYRNPSYTEDGYATQISSFKRSTWRRQIIQLSDYYKSSLQGTLCMSRQKLSLKKRLDEFLKDLMLQRPEQCIDINNSLSGLQLEVVNPILHDNAEEGNALNNLCTDLLMEAVTSMQPNDVEEILSLLGSSLNNVLH